MPQDAGRFTRRRTCISVVAILLAVAALPGCGGGGSPRDDVGGAADPQDSVDFATPPPITGGGPGGPAPPITEPTYAGIDEYERRCKKITEQGALARVDYVPRLTMEFGDSSSVRAAVTLDQSAPPTTVLRRTDAVGQPGLVVSCRVEAQLEVSEEEFDVSKKGWIERSLANADTATWTWRVKPKIGGEHSLSLEIHPVLVVHEVGDPYLTAAGESAIQEYEMTVEVQVPWHKTMDDGMNRLAGTLNLGTALLKAIAAFLTAVVLVLGAGAALRKWRPSKPKPS